MSKEKEGEEEFTPRKLPVIIKLDNPINDGEKDITEIVIKREPTGGDLSGINITNPTIGEFLRVAMKITGIPVPILKKLSGRKAMELTGVIGDFLE